MSSSGGQGPISPGVPGQSGSSTPYKSTQFYNAHAINVGAIFGAMGIGNAAGNHYGMLVVSTPSSTSTSTPGGGKAVLNVTVKDHSSLAVITGVTVTLMTADASQSVGSEVTDATGVASFGGLADGDYVLNRRRRVTISRALMQQSQDRTRQASQCTWTLRQGSRSTWMRRTHLMVRILRMRKSL